MANLVKTVELKVIADDGTAEEKLDKISAKADELREEHPELTVRIDTAEATAKMAVLKGELKEVSNLEIKPKVNDRDLAESEGKLAALRATLFGAGSGSEGGGIFTKDFGEMLPGLFSPVGIAAIVAAIVPLLAELTGVASGFLAAGTGLGAFAALAIPTIDKIKNAYTSLTTAQATYHAAVQLEAKDPTTTNKTAVTTALAQLRIAYDNISPATRRAISGIDQFKNTYEKMAKAFEPNVLGVFDRALTIANELLPDLKPLADDAMNPIDSLLDRLGTFFKLRESISDNSYLQKGGKLIDQTQLTGFGQFLQDIRQLEGPSITAIGTGLGHVATNLGHLFTVMSAKDVVHTLNIAFDTLSGTIRGVTDIVSQSMKWWDMQNKAFDASSKAVEKFAKYMGANLAEAGHYFAVAGETAGRWAVNIGSAVSKAIHWLGTLPGRVDIALGNLGSMLFRAGENAIKGLIGGMSSMVGGAIQDAENWGHDIINALGSPFGIHFSDPSEATKVIAAGRKIAMGLGIGMRSGKASVSAAAQELARSAGISGSGSAAGGAGTRVVLELSGSDQQILTAFAHALRVRGGSPALIGLKT